ncbi:N-formylglutamate amidohydrolase [Ramlibacter rhizophilus]|uniref:N-formylglutamate amidohydrolase n=1 Tax=Ramlibacter rhizophilus TaxID=1781167 RepID=A0A4Z0BVB0_9BURK|nr:N-formylglutamate amidohydrolase [Ramlibacter rhizophilus]TFZ03253.1 N-formylglutamate amidohydrolase [Ramlibacter rhizophilus]
MHSQVVYVPGTTALVLDSPHSGTAYPEDFRFCCEHGVLRRAEDTHVEALYDFAPSLGVAWIEALFPRSYLDANRNVTEIDLELLDEPWPGECASDPAVLAKVRLGKGLIWRCTDDGVPLYDRRLGVAEVQARIEQCWKPYHASVAAAIEAAHARHGYSIHINCHSMPAVAASHATDFPGLVHADFVVGDRDGSTSSPALSRWLCEQLQDLGYSVSYNHPYKGVELVRRYGDPAHGRHSIQLEINRGLYMNEDTLQRHEGFERLKANLRSLVGRLLALDPRSLA